MTDDTTSTDALHFVKTWMKHRRDLDEKSLPYLNSLMDAVAHIEPTFPKEMESHLVSMVPFLLPGTAHRIVGLKYRNHPEDVPILV